MRRCYTTYYSFFFNNYFTFPSHEKIVFNATLDVLSPSLKFITLVSRFLMLFAFIITYFIYCVLFVTHFYRLLILRLSTFEFS
jgi:hypothetical protein